MDYTYPIHKYSVFLPGVPLEQLVSVHTHPKALLQRSVGGQSHRMTQN